MSGIDRTFGNSSAAITLAGLLSDSKERRRVGKVLSTFNNTLNELNKIDTSIRMGLGHLVFDDYKKRLDSHSDIYRSFLSNVLTGKFRDWLKVNNAFTPKKVRILNK